MQFKNGVKSGSWSDISEGDTVMRVTGNYIYADGQASTLQGFSGINSYDESPFGSSPNLDKLAWELSPERLLANKAEIHGGIFAEYEEIANFNITDNSIQSIGGNGEMQIIGGDDPAINWIDQTGSPWLMGSTLDFNASSKTTKSGTDFSNPTLNDVDLSASADKNNVQTSDSYNKTSTLSINLAHSNRKYIITLTIDYSLSNSNNSNDPNASNYSSLQATMTAGGESSMQEVVISKKNETKLGTLKLSIVVSGSTSSIEVHLNGLASASVGSSNVGQFVSASSSVSGPTNNFLTIQAISRGISPKGASWVGSNGQGVRIDRDAGSITYTDGSDEIEVYVDGGQLYASKGSSQYQLTNF